MIVYPLERWTEQYYWFIASKLPTEQGENNDKVVARESNDTTETANNGKRVAATCINRPPKRTRNTNE